jgi:hypothetical protein
MNSESEMEGLRARIREALAADASKSQKELANLLGISPAQVTSLLKPGGRRLQVAEVPIVERYLGIRVFRTEQAEADALQTRGSTLARLESAAHAAPLSVASAAVLPEGVSEDLQREGKLVALEDLPPTIRTAMRELLEDRPAEVWQLTADFREAGCVVGDYVAVDRSESPRNGDLVLAEVRQSAGRWIPVFRLYAPPLLQMYAGQVPSPPLKGHSPLRPRKGHSPLRLGDPRVAVIGPVVVLFRTRAQQ